MKIYTKRGDQGETDLLGGRVHKDHPRVQAYGEVDELNSVLGLVRATSNKRDLLDMLEELQGFLFELGSFLATLDAEETSAKRMGPPTKDRVTMLECWIDSLEEELPRLKSFILPGGTIAAAHLHHARAVSRRTERAVVTLHREEPLPETVLHFLNRLSDLLFVMARVENHRAEISESHWPGSS